MKRLLLLCIVLMCTVMASGQRVAVKNNLLYDLTLTPNIGVEFGIAERSTINLSGGYNPFDLGEYKRFKHWLVQPEYRYWLCEKFNGTFFGVHLHGGEFSVADLKLPFGFMSQLEGHKYEGFFYGAGLSVGHQWILSRHWSIEAALGLGYARVEADKYPCAECGKKIKSSDYNYFGPTKTAISLIYFFH